MILMINKGVFSLLSFYPLFILLLSVLTTAKPTKKKIPNFYFTVKVMTTEFSFAGVTQYFHDH